MDFTAAMNLALNGGKVTRATWSANNAYVIYANNDLIWGSSDHPQQHYTPMCDDIFATDWSAVS